ncbi:MAG: LbtU family siderophore porin [Desulfobacteraceae bacterium]|nr:MAG: LbtU family siderophore porin [Desulfobacteraceae bacterium]
MADTKWKEGSIMKTTGVMMIGGLLIAGWIICSPALAFHEKSAESRIDELSRRIEDLERKPFNDETLSHWSDKITLSGLLEAEAGYSKFEPDAAGEADTEESDITLSTFELGLDVKLNEHVSGHALALWEEDDTEPMDLDEGFITFTGTDDIPAYLHAGKLYVPFGVYDTVFISDPFTLELGETRESAVFAGYHPEMVDVFAGVFNGDVDELGKKNHINSFFTGFTCGLPEDDARDFELAAGLSYLSNMADSDGLSEFNDLDGDGAPDGINDAVGGLAAHLSLELKESVTFTVEYVGALDDFKAGDLAFAPEGDTIRPAAWTTEISFMGSSHVGCGLKYEGTDDCGDFLPETGYGCTVFCHPFECARLGLEYQYQEYANNDINQGVTTQLAVEF